MGAKQKKNTGDERAKPAESKTNGNAPPSPPKGQWWFQHADPVARFTGWLAIWTGILCLATVSLGFIAILQWRELRSTDQNIAEQAKIAAAQLDQMRAEQRAWVSIGNVKIVTPLDFNNEYPSVGFQVTLKNVGTRPALNTFILAHLYPYVFTFKKHKEPSYCPDVWDDSSDGFSLFPNETVEGLPGYAATKDTIESTPIPKTAHLGLVISGCVRYVSAGDPTTHFSSFSARILSAARYALPPAPNLLDINPAQKRYRPEDLFIMGMPMGQNAN